MGWITQKSCGALFPLCTFKKQTREKNQIEWVF